MSQLSIRRSGAFLIMVAVLLATINFGREYVSAACYELRNDITCGLAQLCEECAPCGERIWQQQSVGCVAAAPFHPGKAECSAVNNVPCIKKAECPPSTTATCGTVGDPPVPVYRCIEPNQLGGGVTNVMDPFARVPTGADCCGI